MIKNIDIKRPILICGPTASGKSALAMKLAKEFDAIIINADALQIYSDWKILTARPSHSDEQKIKHFLYGTKTLNQTYSVGNWLRDLEEILIKQKEIPKIIVGGTGLYFTSLIEGLAEIPETTTKIRSEINCWYKSEGFDILARWLKEHDPETFSIIDQKNPARVLRAIEILTQTGKGFSYWQKTHRQPILDFSRKNSFVVNIEKNLLNERIRKRFVTMIQEGAIEEVKENIKHWHMDFPGLKAIGAQEIYSYLMEEITLDEAINKAIIRTRQYAKRQRTWFRSKMTGWTQIEV